MSRSTFLPVGITRGTRRFGVAALFLMLALGAALMVYAQRRESEPAPDRPPGPGGPGFGGPPGFNQEETRLVEQFDKDKDQVLNAEERQAAREFIKKERAEGRGGRRGPGPRGPRQEPGEPGPKVSPAEVKTYPDQPLYDPMTVRTFFLEFENPEWEAELADFKNTDVEVPAKLVVDGKTYTGVGVHFRGASSFGMVSEGRKRSFNLSLDFINKQQRLGGYRTINLLNSHGDPSFLRTILCLEAARAYLPAPKSNLAKVVVNGESWGVFVNVEQFNKDYVLDRFGSDKVVRWKTPGSPRGRATLAYLGEDKSAYEKTYELKSKDDPRSWASLIRLCRVLNETPAEKLVAELEPILDIDGTLKFLALENALINNDGYWVRTSDYLMVQDQQGKFHFLPHDTNETFTRPGGPGFGRGPGGPRRNGPPDGGPEGGPRPGDRPEGAPPNAGPGPGGPGGGGSGGDLDPLIAANDAEKPLISKLLAVPALRAKYLGYVRDIAQNWLDWEKLGPIARKYHDLIAAEVRLDTRKLDSTEDFEQSLTGEVSGGSGFGRRPPSLKSFANQRRAYLLKVTADAAK